MPLNIDKFNIYRIEVRRVPGDIDVTYYFDEIDKDHAHPYSLREFHGELRDQLDEFEAQLRLLMTGDTDWMHMQRNKNAS